jgi:hypothetical protein
LSTPAAAVAAGAAMPKRARWSARDTEAVKALIAQYSSPQIIPLAVRQKLAEELGKDLKSVTRKIGRICSSKSHTSDLDCESMD